MNRTIKKLYESPSGKTIKDYKKDIRHHDEVRTESWNRCDTDGFVTQWAHGLWRRLAEYKIVLLECGRVALFDGLYIGNERIPAELIDQKCPWSYGTKKTWVIKKGSPYIERFGRRYIPHGKGSRIQKKLGLREAREYDLAWADIKGEGKGFSGRSWVARVRVGDIYGGDSKLKNSDRI